MKASHVSASPHDISHASFNTPPIVLYAVHSVRYQPLGNLCVPGHFRFGLMLRGPLKRATILVSDSDGLSKRSGNGKETGKINDF
ncbi:hypothetical protein NPIL_367581 [Nephila pilipes]|uniref:Uncharacterized protein n=1 Tax=Nephila pilipes TaxID=299642 RepID=A0A8X6T9A1_NEPPI|nr:hypothetical protein NPIL_367581 [Nephila pilipes]